jgi:hypothetical protein
MRGNAGGDGIPENRKMLRREKQNREEECTDA